VLIKFCYLKFSTKCEKTVNRFKDFKTRTQFVEPKTINLFYIITSTITAHKS